MSTIDIELVLRQSSWHVTDEQYEGTNEASPGFLGRMVELLAKAR